MPPDYQPIEHTNHRDILAAIKATPCLSELVDQTTPVDSTSAHSEPINPAEAHYDHELDLEITVYGRSYRDKPVGPYVRLFTYGPGKTIIEQGAEAGNHFYVIVKGEAEVYGHFEGQQAQVSGSLTAGEQFGIANMLTGEPHQATVKASAHQEVQLFTISRPAVRLLRKLKPFSKQLERAYRKHAKTVAINELMQRTGLSQDLRPSLEKVCKFNVFSKDHTLFNQTSRIKKLFIIREGWVSRHRQSDDQELTDFLGKGYCLGLEGAHEKARYPYTTTVKAMTEALVIDLKKLREQQNERFNRELIAALKEKFAPPQLGENVATYEPAIREKVISTQARLIDTGIADGNNLLVMDMKLCVRCGNCSMACHKVHDQSRLTRRGIHLTRIQPMKSRAQQSLLVPSVCMHCKDPECLMGCPTGAIMRLWDGRIDINAETCIGCGDCATQCPYDAIAIQQPPDKNHKPDNNKWQKLRAQLGLASAPVLQPSKPVNAPVAVKCDLCSKCASLNPSPAQPQTYSCELNCPTGALVRMKPEEYFSEIGQIQNPPVTAPVSKRNIHEADSFKRWIHLAGIVLALGVTALILMGLHRYGYATPVIGRWNLRQLTGLSGLVGVVGAMLYQGRRRIYRKRYGSLRYWMLAHIYLGLTACLIVLLHAGTSSRTLLTQSLALAFDLVIVTGLLGILIYRCVPRLLTRIEDVPLLIDDLQTRREELKDEIATKTASLSESLNRLLKKEMLSYLSIWRWRLRQYLKQEDLTALRQSAMKALEPAAAELTKDDKDDKKRIAFMETVEAAATLSRVRALIFLHALLKTWLVVHLVCTYSMLALMVVHITQVFYLAW